MIFSSTFRTLYNAIHKCICIYQGLKSHINSVRKEIKINATTKKIENEDEKT